MSSRPGAEFYTERLGRAAALPKSQRSSDVAAWLHSHAVMEAAVAALPKLPPGTGPALVEPLGGKPALAALLQFLAHSFCHLPEDPSFPCGNLDQIGPQLPPLSELKRLSGDDIEIRLQQHTKNVLISGGMPSGAADLETTARMLLLTRIMQRSGESARGNLLLLQAVKPGLFDSDGAARLSQQLQQLQQEVSSSGGSRRVSAGDSSSGGSSCSGSTEPLPTVEQLQVVWHLLAIRLACSTPAYQQLSPATYIMLMQEAASGLLQLQPGNPRTSFWLSKAAIMRHNTQLTAVPPDPLPHNLRCVQLAREQRSDFWLARGGWAAASIAASCEDPTLSPAQASALLAEADAAYQQCKGVVPPTWAETLRDERKQWAVSRPTIAAHMQHSPQRWRADIRSAHRESMLNKATDTCAKLTAAQQLTCNACGVRSPSLRKCSACKGAVYCSTTCQKQHWPAHKAACKAAREAAGPSAGASAS